VAAAAAAAAARYICNSRERATRDLKRSPCQKQIDAMRMVVINVIITTLIIVHNLTVHKFTAKNSGSFVPAST
jgi:hypothetical protein